jgi:hypothetical protein
MLSEYNIYISGSGKKAAAGRTSTDERTPSKQAAKQKSSSMGDTLNYMPFFNIFLVLVVVEHICVCVCVCNDPGKSASHICAITPKG